MPVPWGGYNWKHCVCLWLRGCVCVSVVDSWRSYPSKVFLTHLTCSTIFLLSVSDWWQDKSGSQLGSFPSPTCWTSKHDWFINQLLIGMLWAETAKAFSSYHQRGQGSSPWEWAFPSCSAKPNSFRGRQRGRGKQTCQQGPTGISHNNSKD